MHRHPINVSNLMAVIGHTLSDSRRLKILDTCLCERLFLLHQQTQKRASFLRSIVEMAEGGQVAVVWSGMDCDCVKYSNDVRLVEANKFAVEQHIDWMSDALDGPAGFYITSPSRAKQLKYNSRDLAMEAYENGHPHHITY